jgi:glycosyltransferase involved in cell wall biosynthesis
MLLGGCAATRFLFRWRKPRRPRRGGADILLTGTFHSDNWIGAHLRPLAGSPACRRVRLVALSKAPPLERLKVIHPPAWLRQAVGAVPSRLLTFVAEALREPPDWVGGFHLLVNGLLAGALARVVGARSLYICVGGPAEVLDGGLLGENRLFSRLEVPDAAVERRLLKAVSDFDLVITMGEGARRYLVEETNARAIHVHGGGIDEGRFHPADTGAPDADLVFVGRLAPIKQVDLFLEVVKAASVRKPDLRALVVGDGALRPSLEELAATLGIAGNVSFLGQRADVEEQLRRARVFMLTSQSEGLALSVIEAMMCGLPAIVPAVGDLGDLVKDGVNGYVVAGRRPEDFAEPLLGLLAEPQRLAAFRQAALAASLEYRLAAATDRWDSILASLER